MKKKNIIITIIVILVLIIIGVVVLLPSFTKKQPENRAYYTINDNVITEDTAKELIKTIPFSTTTINDITDVYSGNFVTKGNIKEMILAMVFIGNFQNLITNFTEAEKQEIKDLLGGVELNRQFVTLKSKIDSILKTKYNTDIQELNISEINDKLYFKVLNDKYVLINLNVKDKNFVKDVLGYNIQVINGNLIIDETVTFVYHEGKTYYFYTDTLINNNVLKLESDSLEQLKSTNMKELYKAYKTYRHTFKKHDNNYYWDTTEPLKENNN